MELFVDDINYINDLRINEEKKLFIFVRFLMKMVSLRYLYFKQYETFENKNYKFIFTLEGSANLFIEIKNAKGNIIFRSEVTALTRAKFEYYADPKKLTTNSSEIYYFFEVFIQRMVEIILEKNDSIKNINLDSKNVFEQMGILHEIEKALNKATPE